MPKVQTDDYTQWKGPLIDLTLSADATLPFGKERIELDSIGAAVPFTVELPDITDMTTGKVIWFYDNGNAAVNNITIVANGGDGSAIDNGPKYVVHRNNKVVIFTLVGTRWMVSISTVEELVLGAYSFEGNTEEETVISALDTFTDIAGTGILDDLSKNFNFTTPPNVLENTFSAEYIAVLSFSASVTRVMGAASRNISVAVSRDTGSGFTIIDRTITELTITDASTHTSITAFFRVNNGDKFKPMVKNKDSTDDMIFVDMLFGVLRIK